MFAISRVTSGKQCGFPWTGNPAELYVGSSLAALTSHQELIAGQTPQQHVKLGHNQVQCLSACTGLDGQRGRPWFSTNQVKTFLAMNNTFSLVTGFMTQMEIFFPYLTV